MLKQQAHYLLRQLPCPLEEALPKDAGYEVCRPRLELSQEQQSMCQGRWAGPPGLLWAVTLGRCHWACLPLFSRLLVFINSTHLAACICSNSFKARRAGLPAGLALPEDSVKFRPKSLLTHRSMLCLCACLFVSNCQEPTGKAPRAAS